MSLRRTANIHVLYLERAEDQRSADGKRLAGLHLDQRPGGLGPTLCDACEGVKDSWRGRCDNFQCALRMCCAEGTLFRRAVQQFAVLSPRAAVRYELPKFGPWLSRQGTKRPTEALVIGAALRAAASQLAPESGVTHSALTCTDDGEGDAMWSWAASWASQVRAAASGRVVTLLLEAGAPPLEPSPAAGVLAAHMSGSSSGGSSAAAAELSDVILVVGGPSGVPAAWRERLTRAVGGKKPLKAALRGGVQHSAPALLELLMLNERAELVPLLLDRLALSPEQHKAWRKAERELVHAWLRRLGVGGGGACGAAGAGGGGANAGGVAAAGSAAAGAGGDEGQAGGGGAAGAPGRSAAAELDALLATHRSLLQRLATAPAQQSAPVAVAARLEAATHAAPRAMLAAAQQPAAAAASSGGGTAQRKRKRANKNGSSSRPA